MPGELYSGGAWYDVSKVKEVYTGGAWYTAANKQIEVYQDGAWKVLQTPAPVFGSLQAVMLSYRDYPGKPGEYLFTVRLTWVDEGTYTTLIYRDGVQKDNVGASVSSWDEVDVPAGFYTYKVKQNGGAGLESTDTVSLTGPA